MSLIQVEKLTKDYKVNGIITAALRGVDLTVNKGEFISIAGPSGSGKTTLLNLIGALDKPTSGAICYGGQDITNLSLIELSELRLRKIGFIFQSYNLIPTLTVLENVEFVMLLQGMDKMTSKSRALDILQSVDLSSFKNQRSNRLSGGQQQRVAVARAIAARPEVVLADEPTANLDSENAERLLDLMHNLNREKQITFIFSTHDKMVMDKADKVYLLKDGRIIN